MTLAGAERIDCGRPAGKIRHLDRQTLFLEEALLGADNDIAEMRRCADEDGHRLELLALRKGGRRTAERHGGTADPRCFQECASVHSFQTWACHFPSLATCAR